MVTLVAPAMAECAARATMATPTRQLPGATLQPNTHSCAVTLTLSRSRHGAKALLLLQNTAMKQQRQQQRLYKTPPFCLGKSTL